MDIKQQVTIAPYTYFKLGGPADFFVEVTDPKELAEAIAYAKTSNIPYFVLGGGSNILVTDKGFRGLVIKNKIQGIEQLGNQVKVGSGVPLNQVINYCISHNLAGLEGFLGLPGTVGGAIYNNAHHIGDLIGNHVTSVDVLTLGGEIKTLAHDQLEFAYDSSRFHHTQEIILSALFSLTPGNKDDLVSKGKAAVARRVETQPLGMPSSGCIFQNISEAEAIRLNTPNHTLSAGYLIDQAGLKGTKVGGAVVSEVHANFIVNDGSATSQDVLDLIEVIKAKIKDLYDVVLTPEVFIVGEK